MIQLPAALLDGDTILQVFEVPAAFYGPDGVQHPIDAWTQRADFAEMIAPWTVVPAKVEPQPDPATAVIIGRTATLVDGVVVMSWDQVPKLPEQLAADAAMRLKAAAFEEMSRVTSASGTIMRCLAAGVSVPEEWSAYVMALRAIANGTDIISTALPEPPAYPEGT